MIWTGNGNVTNYDKVLELHFSFGPFLDFVVRFFTQLLSVCTTSTTTTDGFSVVLCFSIQVSFSLPSHSSHSVFSSFPQVSGSGFQYFCCLEATWNNLRVHSVGCACHFAILLCFFHPPYSASVIYQTVICLMETNTRIYRMNNVFFDSKYLSRCNSTLVMIIAILALRNVFPQTSSLRFLYFKFVWCVVLTLSLSMLGAEKSASINHPNKAYLAPWFPQWSHCRDGDKRHLPLRCGFQFSVCPTWHFVFLSLVPHWHV